MKFNIMGFNQEILVNKYNNLNGNDLIVLRTMIDILPRMTRTIEVEGKEFKQLTYELLLEDIPFITQSTSTLKKMVQKFIDSNLIERYVLNKGGKFTYFRATEYLEELLYKEEVAPVKKTNKKIEVKEDKTKLVNELITVGKASIELKEAIKTKSIEELKEVVEDVKLTSNGSVTSKYILNALNNKNKVSEINPMKFNNFKAREYDYNSLENRLLGWDKEEVAEVTETTNDIMKNILAKAI